MIDDLVEFAFVVLGMKPAVERCLGDLLLMTLLGDARLLHDHVVIGGDAVQQVVVTDEAGSVFVDQSQAAELIRLACFATAVQLRVRLEQAEQFVFVGNLFTELRAAISGVANLNRQREPVL